MVGAGSESAKKSVNRFAIRAHVGSVGEEQEAGYTFAIENEAMAQFKLAVLAMGTAESPVHVDSVGDDGHGEEAVANGPGAIVIFGHGSDSVSARVGGVVPRAVVVCGPIHELEMAV